MRITSPSFELSVCGSMSASGPGRANANECIKGAKSADGTEVAVDAKGAKSDPVMLLAGNHGAPPPPPAMGSFLFTPLSSLRFLELPMR